MESFSVVILMNAQTELTVVQPIKIVMIKTHSSDVAELRGTVIVNVHLDIITVLVGASQFTVTLAMSSMRDQV